MKAGNCSRQVIRAANSNCNDNQENLFSIPELLPLLFLFSAINKIYYKTRPI